MVDLPSRVPEPSPMDSESPERVVGFVPHALARTQVAKRGRRLRGRERCRAALARSFCQAAVRSWPSTRGVGGRCSASTRPPPAIAARAQARCGLASAATAGECGLSVSRSWTWTPAESGSPAAVAAAGKGGATGPVKDGGDRVPERVGVDRDRSKREVKRGRFGVSAPR